MLSMKAAGVTPTLVAGDKNIVLNFLVLNVARYFHPRFSS